MKMNGMRERERMGELREGGGSETHILLAFVSFGRDYKDSENRKSLFYI